MSLATQNQQINKIIFMLMTTHLLEIKKEYGENFYKGKKMSDRPIFVCKECGAKCDHDEINDKHICIDCEDVNLEWEAFDEKTWICSVL